MTPIKLALIPLDERPVNTRYPIMIARIAGIDLRLPPPSIRGNKRTGADQAEVLRWLIAMAPSCTALVISCDFLGYGNLISSRISDESAMDVISRLSILAELPVPVHAFSIITRVSNADDDIEEPPYWRDWGTKFYAYSALSHRTSTLTEINLEEIRAAENVAASLPEHALRDWLGRRLRNHTVNLALVDLAIRGKIESLLLTSDDTAAWGLPSRERAWLKSWKSLVPGSADRIQMHPGADEVGTALIAKLINQNNNQCPKIWVDYAIDDDSSRIAPYEDRPVSETILGQIRACGAEPAPSAAFADLVLGVLTPSPTGKDYQAGFLAKDRQTRARQYRQLFDRLAKYQKSGKAVMLADIAYPNGADPLAMEVLRKDGSALVLGSLAAYGAWNTAGNTLGVVIAQGVSTRYINGVRDRALAQQMFLAHRFLEDWGYQTIVRREARVFVQQRWNRPEPDSCSDDEQIELCVFIERRLSEILTELQHWGVGTNLMLKPGSTHLPWKRTFEVDFELVRA